MEKNLKSRNIFFITAILFATFLCAITTIFNNNTNFFVSQTDQQSVFAQNQNSEIYAVMDTFIYENPTALSTQLATIKENTKLVIFEDFKDQYFYKVHTQNIVENAIEIDFGFVFKAHTLSSNLTTPTTHLQTNAITKKSSTLYNYDQNTKTFVSLNIILKQNTKVRILDGYNSTKTHTKISYLNSDSGEVVTAYIKTTDLDVTGVNYYLIIGISTLITCSVIVLILFGNKLKKPRKKENAKTQA